MPGQGEATDPGLVCLQCRNALAPQEDGRAWSCGEGHAYPVVAGVIDCRPPLAGFDGEGDRQLAEELDASPAASFEQLLRRYWACQRVPPQLVERFVAGDLVGEERAMEVAGQIEQLRGAPLVTNERVLEVGCGTAALGTVLARGARVVVSDISLAWLVLARRRLAEAGRADVTVVASSGDRLPFPDGSFHLVVGADVIEHVPDALALARSCYRVLRPGGLLWLSTPNRYSLTPEPHVRIWGLGFLPRRLAPAVVRRLRGVRYDDVRVLSALELRRVLMATGGHVRLLAPSIPRTLRSRYGTTGRVLIDAYEVCRTLPVVGRLLVVVAPLFHATVRRAPKGGR